MKTILIKINSLASDSALIGSSFSLSSDTGAISPSTLTYAQLITGQYVSVPNDATSIIITSLSSLCPNATLTFDIFNPCSTAICGQTYEGYGYLYNWYSIGGDNGRATGGIVKIDQPGQTGNRNLWRVPTDADWNDLIEFLDPSYNPTIDGVQSATAGGKLKTICTTPLNVNSGVWNTPNGGATNQYLWAGVPGGIRGSTGSFSFINEFGLWWSTTERTTNNSAWYRSLNYNLPSVGRFSRFKMEGLSIRLVRPVTTEELSLADGTTSTQNPSLPKYLGNNNRYYATVKIGNQVWMAQNLLETIYNDTPGNLITEVTNPTTWASLTEGARCIYNNTPIFTNGSTVPCTPQLPDISCGTPFQYDGNMGYPLVQNIELGTDTGVVNYNFNAFGAPDRFIVKWNGGIVIDSGYRGNIDFDFGGGSRSIFITSLLGKTDPVTNTVYPDFTNFPDDGYPRVTAPGNGTMSFTKNLAAPTFVTVEVYAPNFGTGWAHTMDCPIVD
jgi:uncharacterized protein (TIGR02145 family)